MTEYDFTEADTCRKYVTPRIIEAGWDNTPYSFTEQVTITDGRITVIANKPKRGTPKRPDYILRYRPDYAIAVVEAKKYGTPAAEGLQQAKDYAQILDLKFAYATNGSEIIEYDFLTGIQQTVWEFPTPEELWQRLQVNGQVTEKSEKHLLEPAWFEGKRRPRYYQEIAINRTINAITNGQHRVLLTMATGTGKTFVAFQICWKLWRSRWNRSGDHRKPRILFLADRNVLVDDPYSKDFAVFGDARYKIERGQIVKSREMYFAIYQAIAKDEAKPGLYKKLPPDFFDLILIDECHRGSAKDTSNWREILEYFTPAYQIGLTATPRRDDNIDTYNYFGNPIFTYSLKQGIEDGFLAPYTVHRVVTTFDATGWRPDAGQLDRYGREIPDGEYTTADFERVIALKARTQAIARHISDFMRQNGDYKKTIVFCVDQEHALDMMNELAVLSPDLMRQHPNYVCRITSNEGDIGRTRLAEFQDVDEATPVIVTTSQLLTTGVDIPTCQNVVLVRVINSMTEFKQIIGRGTRVNSDYGKLFFNILDYTGSATRLFADPDFDGYPALIKEIEIDGEGEVISDATVEDQDPTVPDEPPFVPDTSDKPLNRRKFYVDDGEVEIVAQMVYQLDENGNRIKPIKYTDYTAETVRTLYLEAHNIRTEWADPDNRAMVIAQLEERGIDFEHLAAVTGQPDADPLDLLCHVAFNAPLRTRRERARRVFQEEKAFFDQYGEQARQLLYDLLEKYAEHGTAQFKLPDILKVPPLSEYGNVSEIINVFGGVDNLRQAVQVLQNLLYAA